MIELLISFFWDIFIGLVVAGIIGIFTWNRIKTNHLRKFASAVDSEIQSLEDVSKGIDRHLMEWHQGSIHRLDPYAENMRNYDKKRWKIIKESYEKYRFRYCDFTSFMGHFRVPDPEKFLEKWLNNLRQEIENASGVIGLIRAIRSKFGR